MRVVQNIIITIGVDGAALLSRACERLVGGRVWSLYIIGPRSANAHCMSAGLVLIFVVLGRGRIVHHPLVLV